MNGTKYDSLEKLTKGKPAPISELPSKRQQARGVWRCLAQGVEGGYFQEVTCSFPAAWHAIKRLEETGVIDPGDFSVLLRDYDGYKHVYLRHNETPCRSKGRKIEHLVEKIVTYISHKTGYEHTLAEIHLEFFGKIASPRTDPAVYYQALHATKKARRTIEERDRGKFSAVRRADGTKFYTFQKT